jgi:hypothetical protein
MALRHLLAVVATLPFTSASLANPIADDLVGDYRALVENTARAAACPDPETLENYFGRFGIDLLSAKLIGRIHERFDVFAPLLVNSQRPPDYALDFRIQELYRARADSIQRAEMIDALRQWLTADIRQAAWHGSGRITGPDDAVLREIESARATAAEMLSDWGDADAVPLMNAVEQKGVQNDEALRRILVARARLVDPCAGRVVRTGSNGPLELCAKREDLALATLYREGGSRELSGAELDEVWRVLPAGAWDENADASGGSIYLTIQTAGGAAVTLSPTEPGWVSLVDDAPSERRFRRVMVNRELFDLLHGLAVPPAP